MPMTDALTVAAIVAAFIVFAVVLAWGEYQTRGMRPPARQNTGGGGKPARSTTAVQAKNARSKVEA